MRKGWMLLLLGWGAAAAYSAPMPFDVYSRLYVGMRESLLLELAGRPDYRADGGKADEPAIRLKDAGSAAVRQYGWKASAAIPYITIVSVSGGHVVAIERQPDF